MILTDIANILCHYEMNVVETVSELQQILNDFRDKGMKIGFVPTMGALHKGHASLIERAKKENDIVVCSIFVNPTQFNNAEDLKNYPSTLNSDFHILKKHHCNIAFVPSVHEIYPSKEQNMPVFNIDLDNLDKVMEGVYRPGHFSGVVIVVKKLFDIVSPHRAYFGEKDFQQLAIIKKLVKELHCPVEIIPCPTVREANGLAMSSRNMRLTEEERAKAGKIYQILNEARKKAFTIPVEEVKQWATSEFFNDQDIKLDYFEVVDTETLSPLKNWNPKGENAACIAVYIGKIRLIDNLIF
jgi:pantoate--beta-alanine ligase